MLFFSIIIIVISIIVELGLAFLIYNHYAKTHFTPSFILALFYFIFFLNDLLFSLIFFVPPSNILLATIIMDATLYLGLISIPLLIFFFETLQISQIHFWTLGNMLFSAFLLGFSISRPFDTYYVSGFGWNQDFSDLFLIFLGIYVFFCLFAIFYQYYRYMKNRSKKGGFSPDLVLLGLFIAFLGEYIIQALNLIYFKQISLILGFIVLAFAFKKSPSSFLISPVNLYQFSIIDKDSGMVLFKQGVDIPILTHGLYASTIIQQEIAGTASPAHELLYGDRVFLIEHKIVQNRKIFGVILLDINVFGIRNSLKYILDLFVQEYREELVSRMDEIDKFSEFQTYVDKIFHFLSFHKNNQAINASRKLPDRLNL